MAASAEALSLYRQMMRESGKFTSYIYRTYALRRVRDGFEENRNVTDPTKRQQLLEVARVNLDIIKRQALLNNLYKDQQLVIEQPLKKPEAKMSSNLFDQ